MGITTPLVDDEGYPRADIDVYRARTLRKRLIEIRNDRRAVLEKMERGLIELGALTVSRIAVVGLLVDLSVCSCDALIFFHTNRKATTKTTP